MKNDQFYPFPHTTRFRDIDYADRERLLEENEKFDKELEPGGFEEPSRLNNVVDEPPTEGPPRSQYDSCVWAEEEGFNLDLFKRVKDDADAVQSLKDESDKIAKQQEITSRMLLNDPQVVVSYLETLILLEEKTQSADEKGKLTQYRAMLVGDMFPHLKQQPGIVTKGRIQEYIDSFIQPQKQKEGYNVEAYCSSLGMQKWLEAAAKGTDLQREIAELVLNTYYSAIATPRGRMEATVDFLYAFCEAVLRSYEDEEVFRKGLDIASWKTQIFPPDADQCFGQANFHTAFREIFRENPNEEAIVKFMVVDAALTSLARYQISSQLQIMVEKQKQAILHNFRREGKHVLAQEKQALSELIAKFAGRKLLPISKVSEWPFRLFLKNPMMRLRNFIDYQEMKKQTPDRSIHFMVFSDGLSMSIFFDPVDSKTAENTGALADFRALQSCLLTHFTEAEADARIDDSDIIRTLSYFSLWLSDEQRDKMAQSNEAIKKDIKERRQFFVRKNGDIVHFDPVIVKGSSISVKQKPDEAESGEERCFSMNAIRMSPSEQDGEKVQVELESSHGIFALQLDRETLTFFSAGGEALIVFSNNYGVLLEHLILKAYRDLVCPKIAIKVRRKLTGERVKEAAPKEPIADDEAKADKKERRLASLPRIHVREEPSLPIYEKEVNVGEMAKPSELKSDAYKADEVKRKGAHFRKLSRAYWLRGRVAEQTYETAVQSEEFRKALQTIERAHQEAVQERKRAKKKAAAEQGEDQSSVQGDKDYNFDPDEFKRRLNAFDPQSMPPPLSVEDALAQFPEHRRDTLRKLLEEIDAMAKKGEGQVIAPNYSPEASEKAWEEQRVNLHLENLRRFRKEEQDDLTQTTYVGEEEEDEDESEFAREWYMLDPLGE